MKAPATCSCKPLPKLSWLRVRFYLVILLLISRTAWSFESYPEFQFADKNEYSDFDDPNLISGEFSSDQMNYWTPLDWVFKSWQSPRWFSTSIGSVSTKEFHIDQRLHLRERLHEHLEFRVTWFQDDQWENQRDQAVMELITWFTPQWGVGVVSSLFFHKENNDLGLALIRKKQHHSESRLYVTWPNFQYNIRTHDADKWADHKNPRVLGYVLRQKNLEVSFRTESLSRFMWSSEDRYHNHQRWTGQIQWRKDLRERGHHWFAVRAFGDHKIEGEGPTSGSSTVSPQSRSTRRWILSLNRGLTIGPHDLRISLNGLYRSYELNAQSLKLQTLLPAIWWTLPWRGPADFRRRWEVGLDSSLHNTFNDDQILVGARPRYTEDHRLNLAWTWSFNEKAEIRWLFTFDLDRFGTGETWEGGAGQIRMEF